MSGKMGLNEHLKEVEAELQLAAQAIPPTNSPNDAPPPPPESGGGNQTWGSYYQERLNTYSQLMKEIETQYQNPELTDLFQAAYVQLDLYLQKYLDLIGPEKADIFNKANPGIILNIGKSAKLCRYPQARKYIITIPDEDIQAKPPVWTSMAHELGHFVYWNSEFGAGENIENTTGKNLILFTHEILETQEDIKLDQLENKLNPSIASRESLTHKEALATMLLGWSEEIFADAFGTVVAGKDFADQAKAAYLKDLANLQKKRFVVDTNHPTPFLRPLISAKALEYQGVQNSLWRTLKIKIATNVNLKENFLKSLNPPTDNVTDISDKNLEVTIPVGTEALSFKIDEIKQALDKIIPILLAKISSSKPIQREKYVWSYIEKFADPTPVLVYRVIQGIGYWIKATLEG